MDDTQERIRQWAYRLWQEEGRPEGRELVHWEKARELVAIEDNQSLALKPIESPHLGPEGEPVEEAKLQTNLGEFPTLTDQDEGQPPQRPKSAR